MALICAAMGGKSWEPSSPGVEPKRLAEALGALPRPAAARLPSFVPRVCPDPAPVPGFPDSQRVPSPSASMPSTEKVSLEALSPLPEHVVPSFHGHWALSFYPPASVTSHGAFVLHLSPLEPELSFGELAPDPSLA